MNSTNNTNHKYRNIFLLTLTSLIWGVAFVAQSSGGNSIGPYSFNCIRSLIGAVFLIFLIYVLDKIGITKKPETKEAQRTLALGGVLCGFMLFIASTLQQLALYLGAPVGKAGFLTACYILIVPIIGIFFKKKCGINVWIGVFITLIGLYFLCINENFSVQKSDILLIFCALFFAFHILVIDHFTKKVDGFRMSCIQFTVCGLLGCIPTFFIDIQQTYESFSLWLNTFSSWNVWISILYAGIMSCGIAYTLQIIGQKGVNPAIASLIMSLESVFSVLAGWLLLGETLQKKELLGCILIFIAVVLAQLPSKNNT